MFWEKVIQKQSEGRRDFIEARMGDPLRKRSRMKTRVHKAGTRPLRRGMINRGMPFSVARAIVI